MKAIKRLAPAAALSVMASAVLAPSASALPPGCDWNTDAGVQACMGGSSMDAGKNGNGDTYGSLQPGPTGEEGFLKYVSPYFPGIPRENLLKSGHGVCASLVKVHYTFTIEQALEENGLGFRQAEHLVEGAQGFLCPPG
ncbi:hypothetical protein FZI85_17155 [Mycobacterium sp. CBMA293]|uniref:DUF732 domain-containing protein n=1 Tax=unclassified Mycolicibacterium TaxID=2636767 RepID=UPI0012DF36A9|nr:MULTISPECIES: DUF732 domain-containing protein [unclassified Mycolicibacterium]MUL44453.1 hypothetical protein [Mycolicibacterium sp. CBMA 360]MUL59773.1 hypothetical protein [Mycolicibacterium sp. CBMA 335]MUL68616.1 hypothetical protein [Mycolicibacterium sp. CBMA 311]MUL93993.1 hypothetical protein [Mycolicibacterium sp. CBMA 230]MUM12747.1 hypothetical protein [Mycolicibacterium sp. CBMA 293]